jgi:hypothetical protein
MKNNKSARRTRFTVNLSDYPDLVAIYLRLRVNSIRGLLPALEFGPKLKQAVKDNPLVLKKLQQGHEDRFLNRRARRSQRWQKGNVLRRSGIEGEFRAR